MNELFSVTYSSGRSGEMEADVMRRILEQSRHVVVIPQWHL